MSGTIIITGKPGVVPHKITIDFENAADAVMAFPEISNGLGFGAIDESGEALSIGMLAEEMGWLVLGIDDKTVIDLKLNSIAEPQKPRATSPGKKRGRKTGTKNTKKSSKAKVKKDAGSKIPRTKAAKPEKKSANRIIPIKTAPRVCRECKETFTDEYTIYQHVRCPKCSNNKLQKRTTRTFKGLHLAARKCESCQDTFTPTGCNQKRCSNCRVTTPVKQFHAVSAS